MEQNFKNFKRFLILKESGKHQSYAQTNFVYMHTRHFEQGVTSCLQIGMKSPNNIRFHVMSVQPEFLLQKN